MAYAPAVLAKLTRLAMGPAYVPGPSGNGLDAAVANNANCTLTYAAAEPNATTELLNLGRDLAGLGTFSRSAASVRENVRRVRPAFEFRPTTNELLALLPWITGAAATGSPPGLQTFPLLSSRGVRRRMYLDLNTMVLVLSGVQVGQATFAAQAGGELTLRVEATAVDFALGTFPSSGVPLLDGPRFLMRDATVLVGPDGGEVAYPIRSFSTTIGYTLMERVFNAATDDPVAQDRTITLSLEAPLGAAQSLWALGGTPTRIRIPFTAVVDPVGPKTVMLQFLFPAAVFPLPPVGARVSDGEVFVRVEADACTVDLASVDTELLISAETSTAD